jgi:ABC-2 type transport system permease protein
MKAFTIFKAVTKNWIRSRSGLFFSILFPVLLLVVFGLIFSGIGGSSQYSIFVQNLDLNAANGEPSELSTAFITALNSSETFSITEVPADENATEYARDVLGPLGGSMRILVISEGFEDDLINGTLKVRVGISYYTMNMSYQYIPETEKLNFQQGLVLLEQYAASLPDTKTSLTIMLDPSDQSGTAVKSIIVSVASAFNYQLIGAENYIEFNETSVVAGQFSLVDMYVPGVTAAFIMINGVIGLTANTTEFKRRGIIKRLSITPLTKLDWIIGNILSQTLLNLMLAGIMIGVGWVLFNITIIPDVFTIIIILLGSIMFSGMGMILAGFIKDVEAASAIGNAITFPMMYLSGTFFPVELMPSYLQTVSKALPLTYFSEGLRCSMLYKDLEGICMSMAILAVLAAVFISIGALVTRWKSK